MSWQVLDGIALETQVFFRKASLLPRQVLGPALSPEMDLARLEEAVRLGNLGRHAESVSLYEALLSDYPNYSGRSSLKLRLGRAVLRAGDLPRAERFYREALEISRDPDESEAASRALKEIPLLRKRLQAVLVLEKELASSLEPGLERRQKAFRLGTAAVKLQDMEKAAWAFGEAYRADPEGELAVSCLFKEGWALRVLGRVDDAFDRFQTIVRSNPNTPWAMMAYLQMAEAYKTRGDPRAAVQFYEKAIGIKTKDAAFTAIARTQAACTYLFDLNDPEKAKFYFQESTQLFPASPFSSVEKRIQEQTLKKNLTFSTIARPDREDGPAAAPRAPIPSMDPLAPSGPLLKLVEQFLPLFVETFSDRLSRYMQVAGEKQLTRRFTQEEFRSLVVRRVQDKFPGKVTDVMTEIHSDGFMGTATLRVGVLSFNVQAKVGILVRNDRPYTLLREIKVGKITLPDPLLKYLEERVNETVDKKKYPLKVTQCELQEGYALISVELVEK